MECSGYVGIGFGKLSRKRFRIEDGLGRTITAIRIHRVGGVPHQRDATKTPSRQGARSHMADSQIFSEAEASAWMSSRG
jgi:hypothetical protein